MTRIALGVQYDGSDFCGWQSQKHDVRTVQEVLEQSLSRVANEPIKVVCAGRTDTGVHGICQVVHFDTQAKRDNRAWVLGANSFMAADVVVIWAHTVVDDFHARFSALSRSYRYVIYNKPTPPALYRQQVCWNRRPLDAQAMQEGANFLIGEHDFSAYRAAGCQAKSPRRELKSISVCRSGDMLTIDVQANAFLQHMVRNIAGVLMKIGAGERPPIWAQQVLRGRDRRKGGVTAPPYGLYFIGVEYGDGFGLPDVIEPQHILPSL